MKLETALKNEARAQKQKVELLENKNKQELDFLKNNHKMNKQKIQTASKNDLVEINSSADQEKLVALDRKSKILEDLGSQMEKIKNIHSQEQLNLDQVHQQRLDQKREAHQMQLTSRQNQMQEDIATQEEESNYQINKMRKLYQNEKKALETGHNSQIINERSLGQEEIQSQKKIFGNEQRALQQKYETKLSRLEKTNNDIIAKKENEAHTKIHKDKIRFDSEIEKTRQDGEAQLATQSNRFEKNFTDKKNKDELLLQKLEKNKSSLIQDYKQNIYQRVNVLENQALDPFYSITDITPTIDQDETSYTLSLKVPKEQADYYILTGSGRELKLSMTRRFNEKLTNDNGEKEVIAKSESVSKSIKLDEIIDPKTIQKRHENGTLSFFIGKS